MAENSRKKVDAPKPAARKRTESRSSGTKTDKKAPKPLNGEEIQVKPSPDKAAPVQPARKEPLERGNGNTPQSHSAAAKGRRAHAGQDRSGKYVYCIIQSTEAGSFGDIGIGSDPTDVYTIGYQDIAAVVSDTPIEVYDPTRENVLSHERVNETVMHDHTVIPMSFGTVFKTADDIVELLRSAYSAFRDVLGKMENKLEFGLKILWDPDEIIQVVEKDDESLRRLREEILKQRGSTYFARMQYERLVDSLLQERSEAFVNDIFEGLRPVSVATRVNKPIGERMIMNAAFLVSRDQEPVFDAQVKAVAARHPHLTFKYTGPWPPYNFVNIRLKLERARETQ